MLHKHYCKNEVLVIEGKSTKFANDMQSLLYAVYSITDIKSHLYQQINGSKFKINNLGDIGMITNTANCILLILFDYL